MKILSSVFIALNLVAPFTSVNDNNTTFNPVKLSSNDVSSSSIASTNVNYDLRYFFGGADYQNYDIYNPDLTPNENDPYNDFKFLLAKPIDNDLYLYFYFSKILSSDINSVEFKISNSNAKNEDGTYTESFKDYSATVVNYYGARDRFYKVRIDNFAEYTDGSRIYINNCKLNYLNGTLTTNYVVNHELLFNKSDTGDVIYEYFKDDYVLIKDHVVGLLLTQIDSTTKFDLAGGLHASYEDYVEDFYYFFSTDRNIDDLLEIQYDYTLCSFTEKHHSGRTILSSGAPGQYKVSMYTGLSNGEKVIEDSKTYTTYANNVVAKGTSVGTVTRPYFLFWDTKATYNLENIQNCKNLENLTGDENKGFKEFIEDTQKANNNKFDWAFKVHTDRRSMKGSKKAFGLWSDHFTTSYCHDVLQAMIVRLKFRENLQVKDMLVLDKPIDTSYSYVNHVEYDDLFDDIGDLVDDTKDNIQNTLKILLAILLFSLLLPIFNIIYKSLKKLFKKSDKQNYKKSNKGNYEK